MNFNCIIFLSDALVAHWVIWQKAFRAQSVLARVQEHKPTSVSHEASLNLVSRLEPTANLEKKEDKRFGNCLVIPFQGSNSIKQDGCEITHFLIVTSKHQAFVVFIATI